MIDSQRVFENGVKLQGQVKCSPGVPDGKIVNEFLVIGESFDLEEHVEDFLVTLCDCALYVWEVEGKEVFQHKVVVVAL